MASVEWKLSGYRQKVSQVFFFNYSRSKIFFACWSRIKAEYRRSQCFSKSNSTYLVCCESFMSIFAFQYGDYKLFKQIPHIFNCQTATTSVGFLNNVLIYRDFFVENFGNITHIFHYGKYGTQLLSSSKLSQLDI